LALKALETYLALLPLAFYASASFFALSSLLKNSKIKSQHKYKQATVVVFLKLR